MAYVEEDNLLAYFQPSLALASAAAEVLRAIDIGAASGNHGEYLCVKPCMLFRGQITMTEEAASGTTTPPTVVLTKRPTPLSATDATAVMTITVPSGTAIGKTVYKEVDPVQFMPGDSLHVAWTVGTGTPTGIGIFSALCHNSPKTPFENADMVESV